MNDNAVDKNIHSVANSDLKKPYHNHKNHDTAVNVQGGIDNTQILSHLDDKGNLKMVDVGDKTSTTRMAVAQGKVFFTKDVFDVIMQTGGQTKKGSITTCAQIAAIMASKRTHDLIPLCHQLPLDKTDVDFTYLPDECAILVQASTKTTHKTGVEMEALMAVSIACLTIYDMTKAISHDISIGQIELVQKTGGKSHYVKS